MWSSILALAKFLGMNNNNKVKVSQLEYNCNNKTNKNFGSKVKKILIFLELKKIITVALCKINLLRKEMKMKQCIVNGMPTTCIVQE